MEMPQLIVTQQALLRYYGNAIKDLTCHNIINGIGTPAVKWIAYNGSIQTFGRDH
jgi:hypothetical protein